MLQHFFFIDNDVVGVICDIWFSDGGPVIQNEGAGDEPAVAQTLQ